MKLRYFEFPDYFSNNNEGKPAKIGEGRFRKELEFKKDMFIHTLGEKRNFFSKS